MKNKFDFRRFVCAVMILAMAAAMLTGCGKKQEEPAVGMPNPMTEVAKDEVAPKTGISLDAPEGAENVHYFVIAGDKNVAQVDFTLGGKNYTYRACINDIGATPLSGVYFNKATESYCEVAYCKGTIYTEGKTAVCYWYDVVPDISYSLTDMDCNDASVLLDTANLCFVPAQGDAIPDEDLDPVEYPDLGGKYQDADGSTIELVETEPGKFDAVIGIFRLAEFTGTGELETDGMKLTLDDPNGEKLYAEFTFNADNVYKLVITESHWSLLETGTEFDGFNRVG